MKRLAITGGIAEGKSTVAGYLRDLGFVVESADRIARAVFQRESVQNEIARLLGCEPPIEPEALRKRLQDPAIRRQVNRLTHPGIVQALRQSPAQVFEVPLLIEACLQGEFDQVWVVTCGEEMQRQRLTARFGNGPSAEALLCTQLTTRAKIPFADAVIRTNQPESAVQRCVSVAAERELR